MPCLDKPLHELQEYRGINPRPGDFCRDFGQESLPLFNDIAFKFLMDLEG